MTRGAIQDTLVSVNSVRPQLAKRKQEDAAEDIRARSGLSFPTAGSALDLLVELGIARELTGKRRNRVFVYDQYLAILNEGAER